MRRAANILRSSKGVSMPLALLLFLVCATLASIVLAAATATSGQATTLKDNEQSYYAVTSAAKLLRDELNGQTVVITKTTRGTGGTATTTTEVRDELRTGSVATPQTLLESAASSWNAGAITTPTTYTLDATSNADALKVTVLQTIRSNGNIELVLSQNAANNNPKVDGYKLKLTLTADVAKETEETTIGGVETTIEETRITWWADELQTTGD